MPSSDVKTDIFYKANDVSDSDTHTEKSIYVSDKLFRNNNNSNSTNVTDFTETSYLNKKLHNVNNSLMNSDLVPSLSDSNLFSTEYQEGGAESSFISSAYSRKLPHNEHYTETSLMSSAYSSPSSSSSSSSSLGSTSMTSSNNHNISDSYLLTDTSYSASVMSPVSSVTIPSSSVPSNSSNSSYSSSSKKYRLVSKKKK